MKYIHIGFPKNLSTTLQRDYFSAHPEILHLGVGIESNIDYIDDDVNLSCEEFFQYAKDFFYEKNKPFIKSSFDKWFQKFALQEKYRAIGISLELLSFSWTPDQIDTTIKAKRVFEVFGKDTKIIMIIRNQFELLKSLYRESVKLGYYGSYNDFMSFTYCYQDRNFLHDFLFDNTYNLYAYYFGKENIHVIPIEQVRNMDGTLMQNDNNEIILFKKINEILKLNYYDLTPDHHNDPLSDSGLKQKVILNKSHRHDIGNAIFERGVNSHRLRVYYNNYLKLGLKEENVFKDVLVKRKLIKKAEESMDVNQSICYDFDSDIEKRLTIMFKNSNQKLSKLVDEGLPEQYLR